MLSDQYHNFIRKVVKYNTETKEEENPLLVRKIDPFNRLSGFWQDRKFLVQLYRLAMPITLQNLLTASLNLIGSIMVGQLGDAAIASVGLAGQVFFLLNLILFGIGSGSAMFTAQLWGNKDLISLRKVFGMCIALGLALAGLFVIFCELNPGRIIGIFTIDPQVISLGGDYLRIYAWSFLFFSISSGYAAILRSIGEVRLPMIVTVTALIINIALNYVLIFGALGLPAMGIIGAAISAVIARVGECLALVFLTSYRKYPVTIKLSEMQGISLEFLGRILKPVMPVILNETLWSLAITVYNFVYARIGTSSIAAMNIVATVDNLALVPFFGLSSAVGILIGHKIGAGDKEGAYRGLGKSLGLTAFFALLVCITVLSIKGGIVGLYKVTPDVAVFADRCLIILAFWMFIRSQNMVLIIGMMRSGGDTHYSLLLDGIIIWILGVPMAILGGFILHLPVYLVYLMVMSEELTKCILGLRRYFTKKWIHDLAERVTSAEPGTQI